MSGISRPTEEEIQCYKRDGVVLLKGVLSQAEIELAQQAVEGAVNLPGPYAEFIEPGQTWGKLFDADAKQRQWVMFQDQFASRRVDQMRELAHNSRCGSLIAQLMGSDTASFFYDHTIVKHPSGAAEGCIPWHQDLPYWRIDGDQIGSIWIPLDFMSEQSGVSWILGSHRWGLFRPQHFADASPYEGTQDLPTMSDIDALIAADQVVARSFAVEPGDVLAFDARIIHGSKGNTDVTHIHRRIALRFGGDDAVYYQREGETAIPTPDVALLHGRKHGQRITCDVFPQVWPKLINKL